MSNDDLVTVREEKDVPDVLKHLCVLIDEILAPAPAFVEMSALTTLICRNAVRYNVDRQTLLTAVGQGYDVFIRAFQEENTAQ